MTDSNPTGGTSDEVSANLRRMDEFDFVGWNNADWHGVFAHLHTDDVYVDMKGAPATRGIEDHIAAMEAVTQMSGGTPPQVDAHPISFGSGEWAIAEEYIWS